MCKTGRVPLERVPSDLHSVVALDLVIFIRNEYLGLCQDTVRFCLVVDVHAVLSNSSALRSIEIVCVSALSMAYQFFANFRRPYTNA